MALSIGKPVKSEDFVGALIPLFWISCRLFEFSRNYQLADDLDMLYGAQTLTPFSLTCQVSLMVNVLWPHSLEVWGINSIRVEEIVKYSKFFLQTANWQ